MNVFVIYLKSNDWVTRYGVWLVAFIPVDLTAIIVMVCPNETSLICHSCSKGFNPFDIDTYHF